MPEALSIRDTQTEARVFGQRAVFAAALVLLAIGALAMRYFHLQVVEHEKYRTESDRNRIHARPVPPRRGLIFDRNGTVLADNRPIFNLMVTRERVPDVDATLADVRSMIGLEDADAEAFRRRLRRHLPFEAVPLRFNIDEESIARLAVDRFRLPGVEVVAELVRHYPYGPLFAHAIGYVGRINEAELATLDANDYNGTNLIGKNGVERFYEDELHGSVGYENVETNARGRVLRVIERIEPGAGGDLTLELDMRVQQAAVEGLGAERGSLVAIDPRTGGVLALVSTPSFDPNPFVSGIGASAYAVLRDSADRPLINRAIQGQYPPGSTVKPMYGLGGLYYAVSTPKSAVSDPGWYRLGGVGRKYRDWKKWGHGGAVNVSQAITESCDVYFYDLAHRVGIERMHDFVVMFGLGSATGVDQTNERAGVMPNDAWKRRALGQQWYPGETISAGIGQGYVLTTPMQLAVMTATIANRGRHFRPRLIAKIGGRPVDPELVHTVEMPDPTYWDVVFAAMEAVVHSPRGTAKSIARDLPYRIAGKTGTAQVVGIAQDAKYESHKLQKHQRDHALFIAFAPVEEPRIAVAVIVENGEHGGSAAAPIARKVMDAWLLPPPAEPPPAEPPPVEAPPVEQAPATAPPSPDVADAPGEEAVAPAGSEAPPPGDTP
jgi:penicillin-binding protein 2